MDLFRGYVRTNGKKAVEKFKDVPLRSFEEVKDLDEYAGVLAENVVLVDIDDAKQSEKLMDIVEALQLNCRVYQTTRGRHFLFSRGEVDKCGTGVTLAIGIKADIKSGNKPSYEVLKYQGEERFIEWDEEGDLDVIPKWLMPIKGNAPFVAMEAGDGRNSALYAYIIALQRNGFGVEECRDCIRLINKYVLDEPLGEDELDVILRDEAFNLPVFYDGKTFLFDQFAKFLRANEHIVKINNQLHVYRDGIYISGYQEIETAMVRHIPNLKKTSRREVLDYLELIVSNNTSTADARYIAFNNGLYDLATDTMRGFRPDIVVTNRIDFNYVPDAYNKLCDNTLNKLACKDKSIRALLEECVGYCLYRRNELGKAFILTGEKQNGKSTFLDMIKTLLGDDNISSLDIKELGDRFSTSMMFGKLANIGDDIGDDFMQGTQVAVFKKIVTGNRVKAERKGQDPFEFNPYVKLLFSANDIPRMKDKTGAVIRRLVIIPFNAKFTKDDPEYDPFIKYRLCERESIEYLITLGIAGLKRVLQNSAFTTSEAVEREVKEYEVENNPILLFIEQVDVEEIINEVTSDVFRRYTVFCAENNFTPMAHTIFSRQINKRLGLVTKEVRDASGKKRRVFVKEGK